METKEDFIKAMSKTMFRVMNKHARLEALPVRFENGSEATHRELHVIQAIGESADSNITDLAHHFGITKSAASQMVSKLEKKGFVVKGASSRSNKEVRLALTGLGNQAFHVHEQFHGEHMADMVRHVSVFPLSQIAAASVLLEVMEGVVDDRLSEKEA